MSPLTRRLRRQLAQRHCARRQHLEGLWWLAHIQTTHICYTNSYSANAPSGEGNDESCHNTTGPRRWRKAAHKGGAGGGAGSSHRQLLVVTTVGADANRGQHYRRVSRTGNGRQRDCMAKRGQLLRTTHGSRGVTNASFRRNVLESHVM